MTVPRARRVEVPQSLRKTEEFTGPHYASAYAIPVGDARSRTPEEWARSAIEEAPAALRFFLRFGWAKVLGLRMGPRSGSAEHVLGWRITGSAPDSLTMDGHSGLFSAYNVVLTQDSTLMWATAQHFKGRGAGLLWGLARPVHQIAVPYLLRRSCKVRLRAAGRASG
ncbi:DUF2867 domain-containing protein [Streptomyces sp. I05A-00742]|uniref:DUF2867 domain-containing protein n=1 Tax=Streptomyces sp. I05A-00742 TaxID=2732853 RepID=UPI00148819CA|nr:DUF2867 domain-containing protein [Streptomyces sp. I05A-00742]